MSKPFRTLALSAAAAITVGLTGCGSDLPAEGQAKSDRPERNEPDCEVLPAGEFVNPDNPSNASASAAIAASSEDILKQQRSRLVTEIGDPDIEWSDTEYIIGWPRGTDGSEPPTTLDNVRIAISDSSVFHSCETEDATSVELIEGGNPQWNTYRVTFDSAPPDLGYGMIVFDDPYADADTELERTYADLWNLSGEDVEDAGVVGLLQATVNPKDIRRSGY